MRNLIWAIALLVIVPTSLWAQLPKGNVFFGYSYLRLSPNGPGNLNGWDGSLEGRVVPFLGLVVDVSGHYKTNSATSVNTNVYNALLGPRVSFSVRGVRPFAHALFGVAHENSGGVTDNSFATAIGGGVDFKLAPIIGWRIQADALRTSLFGSSEVNLRASTGLVLRF